MFSSQAGLASFRTSLADLVAMAAAARAVRDEWVSGTLAELSAVVGVPLEVNAYGAVELTGAQLEVVLAAVRTAPAVPGVEVLAGLPIWRKDDVTREDS